MSASPSDHRSLVNRFTTIEKNRRWLQEGLARYPDADTFVDDWLSEEFDPSEHIAALERFYDRTVNSLNQIIDITERALVDRGEIDGPRKPGGPGRSQRLADHGVVDQDKVAELKRYLERRNVFQKEYPDLGPEAGRDAYDDAKEFLKLLPKLIQSLREWVGSAGLAV